MNKLLSEQTADAKLESLRDFRSMQLEVARGTHAEARAVAEERHSAVESEQRKVDAGHEAARAQMTDNAVISVDALTRIRHFTTLTVGDLQRAQVSLQEAQDRLAGAHTVVVKKLTDLRAIERLRDKRKSAMDRERSRQDQKRLDDHALVRLARRSRGAESR